jgi:hypothetical protein
MYHLNNVCGGKKSASKISYGGKKVLPKSLKTASNILISTHEREIFTFHVWDLIST